MPFSTSSAPHNGHPHLLDGHPVDDIAREVMSRLAAQAMQMGAHGFHLAMQEILEDEEEQAREDADDQDDEQ